MKATGIVRPIDDLGRIVIPIELRRTLDLKEKDGLEIYVHNSNIILRKHQAACIFCGKEERLTLYRGKLVCEECMPVGKAG